ncbi:M56 family metallopeptidase [Flavobacterium hungaricum]|uniref:Peptidase M56 n=1 Tax=Flavobacterium hungaricum TaxID=2082725 RepID=A0ABR9THH5_9FLAO|nr:M56 family metallopeptidase [Flavobacterium hungaricum]MBE8724811.1 peptidase M56 [Flavobacterium hungaricum]
MEALFIFILKSSGLLATFYFAYFFLLRKETFFNSSRFFLLAGLVTSVVLPFIVYTKIIWIEPAPAQVQVQAPAAVPTEFNTADAVANYHYNQTDSPQIAAVEENFEINWNLVSMVVYGIGFAAFMIKFGLDFYSLNSVLKGKDIQQQEDFKFIDVNENIAPFSYFDYIVYNSSLYTAAELENILEHEKVHSDQKHTIDVLITRIFCILFWFNPIIWLYKKAILQNLEFIADSEAAKKITDKKAYQYTLLKITTHETCVAITNHFYQSLIKKRIVMLNKNQSKKRNYWKYYAVIPALGAFVLLFQIETIAQEKKQNNAVVQRDTIKETKELITITKNTTDKELDDLKGKLKTKHNVDFQATDVKRNAEKELTAIQIQLQSESGKKQTVSMNGSKAIKDITLAVGTDTNGAATISVEGLRAPTPPNAPVAVNSERVVIRNYSSSNGDTPTPPTPPVAPVFPQGPIPQAPAMDMTKMPKPPKAPKDTNDKAAMSKFESEMADFEKKMAAFEPDMRAFEKEMEETMGKRSAIFEKEMEKYQIAMEKYGAEMEKYQLNLNPNFNYNFDMKFQERDIKLQEKEIRLQERDIRLQERDIKLQAAEMKKQAAEMKKQAKEMKKQAEEMKREEKKYSTKS